MYAAPAISAIDIDLSGDPLTRYAPPATSMSSGDASSSAAQIRFAFSWTRSAAAGDRFAPTASERDPYVPQPHGPALVSPWTTSTLAGIDPEPVGRDLRVAGVETLSVRRCARVHGRRAGRVHADRRRLEEGRLQADALRPDRRATARGRRPRCRWRGRRRGRRPRRAAAPARCGRRRGPGRPASCRACPRSRPSRRRCRAGSRTGRASLGMKFLRRISTGSEADLEREAVHHHLDPVGHLRAARPRIASVGELVREDAGEVQVDGVERVAAAGDREAELGDECGVRICW